MSVIMAAGKKNTNQKKKQKSLSRVPSESEGLRPPYSDDKVSVWYWVLDGQVTTIIFDKIKKEVWCNGFLLDTYDGFIEGQEDDQDFDDGDVIDFAIFVTQTQMSHRGRLIRLAETAEGGGVTHQLLVDDSPIPENVFPDSNPGFSPASSSSSSFGCSQTE